MAEKPCGSADESIVESRKDLTQARMNSGFGGTESGRTTGVLLLLAAIGTVACSVLGRFALGLSEDSGTMSFAAYQRHPFPIFLTYAVGMIAGLLFILAAPLLARSFAESPRLRIAATCQALAGLVLALSASRWLIVLPFLKKQYDNPLASSATRAAIEVNYESISYFLGITLGEHLFAILTGVWILILSFHILRLPGEKSWQSWIGIVAGFGWLLGSLEQLDFSLSSDFLVFLGAGPIIWVIWTAFLARQLTRRTYRSR
ncbi:MAG: DUF4386 domain-containing protein [Actinomycetota bacterium]|nr:DUF4386 domain-containing protein [Actinomycetota bacterium]